MVAWVIALVLFAHGIGHSMGIVQATNLATINPQWQGDSWLLTGPLGATSAKSIGILVWSVALVGFTILAASVVGWVPASWFAPVGVLSAVVSIVGIALFPLAFPTFSTLGALAVDVAVLAAVLVWRWQPAAGLA
jgi:hypothetical protein